MRAADLLRFWPNYTAANIYTDAAHCPGFGDVARGAISGHPDFELATGYSEGASGTAVSNLTLYGNGLAYSGTKLSATVEPGLEFHTDGLPKPMYCNAALRNPAGRQNDPRCGWHQNQPFSSGPDAFASWYRDAPLYNLRSGVVLSAPFNKATALFTYASPPAVNASVGFHPLDSIPRCAALANGTLDCASTQGRAWPFSKKLLADERVIERVWSFTTELHTFFTYTGANQSLEFDGDDDVWVFLNERLAVDLGGLHSTIAVARIDLSDAEVAQQLNLTVGGVYALDMFHAERHTWGSNFVLSTSLVSGCSVLQNGLAAYTWNPTSMATDWKLVGALPSGSIQLARRGVFDSVAYAFLQQRANVGSGFVVTFTFNASADEGQGFVFGLVRETITNLNGGSGANLGFRNMGASWALAFDFEGAQVRMHYALDGGANPGVAQNDSSRVVYAPLVYPNALNDGREHAVEVRYYAKSPPWMDVLIDGDLFLQRRGIDLEGVLGGREAWVGFTAATGQIVASDIAVANVQVITVAIADSKSRVVAVPAQSTVADGRAPAVVTLQTVDACGNAIAFGGYAERAGGTLVGTATAATAATVVDNGDGTYGLAFTSTAAGAFTARVWFGANASATSSPATGFSTTLQLDFYAATPQPSAAPSFAAPAVAPPVPWAVIVACAVLAGVAVCGCALVGACALRYRDRWRREKAFVEAGRIAALDTGVALMGDDALDALQAKLQAVREALNRERARAGGGGKGDCAALEGLLRSKGELAEQVRMLKERRQTRLDEPAAATAAAWVRKSFSVRALVLDKPAATTRARAFDASLVEV